MLATYARRVVVLEQHVALLDITLGLRSFGRSNAHCRASQGTAPTETQLDARKGTPADTARRARRNAADRSRRPPTVPNQSERRRPFFFVLAATLPESRRAAVSAIPLKDDILWGGRAIADEVGRPLREVYYLLQEKRLDADKVGDVWVTTRTRLQQQFNGQGQRISN
jgi:hypothetical protein